MRDSRKPHLFYGPVRLETSVRRRRGVRVTAKLCVYRKIVTVKLLPRGMYNNTCVYYYAVCD